VYVVGPNSLWVWLLTPPSRYSRILYSKPRPSIFVQIPSGMKPSIVHW
jgi:hypothetical protein